MWSRCAPVFRRCASAADAAAACCWCCTFIRNGTECTLHNSLSAINKCYSDPDSIWTLGRWIEFVFHVQMCMRKLKMRLRYCMAGGSFAPYFAWKTVNRHLILCRCVGIVLLVSEKVSMPDNRRESQHVHVRGTRKLHTSRAVRSTHIWMWFWCWNYARHCPSPSHRKYFINLQCNRNIPFKFALPLVTHTTLATFVAVVAVAATAGPTSSFEMELHNIWETFFDFFYSARNCDAQ